MDILIKSFNRPYYLERCIQSIYANVLDDVISITILDDGTPKKYLEKILNKFPEVVIVKSALYAEKSNYIEHNLKIEKTQIPIHLWLNAAKNATEYFVLLEDDIWFTQKINLLETKAILQKEKIYFLKLFWLNNPKLVHGITNKVLEYITIYSPKVFTKNPILHRLIFGITRFGNRKLMQFLNLYSKDKALQYYSIYGVAGVVFHKDYFLSLWNNNNNEVDENLQLIKAVKFWYKNPHIQFARTNSEFVATGFLSSATNKSFNATNFDLFQFNKIINEAWYADEFRATEDFLSDLNTLEIAAILSNENHSKAQVEDWNQWVFDFKKQFQDIGCTI